MTTLRDKTLLITGASRGIGLAIALRAARDGANVVVAAKTVEPHSKLEGTIHTAVAAIEAAGGRGLACQVDVRDEGQVQAAVDRAVETFGGIDILVNNASALDISGTRQVTMKRFDLMHAVNVRATFMTSKLCLPHLEQAENPHILMLAPPLSTEPVWFGKHLAYTLAKYGMSLCALGLAEELRDAGIAVNAVWPRTLIATAAVSNILGGMLVKRSRKPEIVADAAHAILVRDARSCTGQFLIDEEVLLESGVHDLDQYAVEPGSELQKDLFID
jgi:citronellol/citronellal dehydrogenase